METIWDGITRAETLDAPALATRSALADAARDYDWTRVLELLSGNRQLINASRPGGRSLYSPLHQAAHGGAPTEVVGRLLELGAWRTLQNARGERPVDVATRMERSHLLRVLKPERRRRVPHGILSRLEAHFHQVIRGRAEKLVQEHSLRLPPLEPLLELEQPQSWFAVPGMYGGFSYQLAEAGVEPRLIVESWCRVVDGSGERHEVTSDGSKLVAEGFV